MPPKRGTARAKRGTTNPRGRGRGRGAKAASESRPEATEAEPQANEEESLFVPKDEPAVAPTSTAPTTDVDMTGAGEADATTTNTEAADTAAGASEPENTAAMASAASSAPSAAASPALSGATEGARGGKKAKAMARMPTFKGRRSKEEREAMEAEAQAKRREKMAQLNSEARAAGAGRGRGDRGRGRGRGGDRGGRGGRGGFMGSREQHKEEGIFTEGWATGIDQSRLMIHRGKSSGAGFSSGSSRRKPVVKSEGGDGEQPEAEDGGYISSDPEADSLGPRIDVDRINIKDEFDDLEITGEGPAQQRSRNNNTGLAPVRLQRREHHNAARKIVAEAPGDPEIKTEDGASSSKKGKQKAKDVQVTGEQAHWRGAWGWENEDGVVNIKDEPTEDSAIPTDIPEAPIKDAPSSPELSRKTKPRMKSRRKPRWGEFVAHTEEEKAEQARILEARESVAKELGTIVPPREPAADADTSTPRDADGDTAMNEGTPKEQTEPKQEAIDNRQDRVYLFQFPPVLPSLTVKDTVKPEPTSPTHPHDVDAPAAATAESSNKQPQQPAVKIEDDGPSGLDQVSPDLPTVLSSGKVGKLRVHESGRTTLDWGGTSLELHAGMEASFLQDIVISKIDPQEERVGRDAGQAMSFGRVFGKFVVTPDFEEIVG
ncbi:RNA polymerase III RPC4-domain-containing protein [Phyllosticta citribraziliensis]|uniref:RNA polymerase III RPC4-domain-containing protein n=1 Tax=Phyllosticta citribraziliensis TaxID=989973 RepID=A0ABR1M1D4_9PEZI